LFNNIHLKLSLIVSDIRLISSRCFRIKCQIVSDCLLHRQIFNNQLQLRQKQLTLENMGIGRHVIKQVDIEANEFRRNRVRQSFYCSSFKENALLLEILFWMKLNSLALPLSYKSTSMFCPINTGSPTVNHDLFIIYL